MVYKVSDILKDVRVALDRNNASEQLSALGDSETLTLDEIIESKIEQAAAQIEQAVDYSLLHWEQAHAFGDSIFWGDDGSGWIVLPEDFMRLLVFEMSDWERACYKAISVDDPQYALQRSRRAGLRGSKQHPVVAITMRPVGLVLEFYTSTFSSDPDECAKVQRALYVPWPKIGNYQMGSGGSLQPAGAGTSGIRGIDLAERCYDRIVLMIAALTCATYGATEQANVLQQQALH